MAFNKNRRAITAGIAFALIAGQVGTLFATSRQAFAELPDIGGPNGSLTTVKHLCSALTLLTTTTPLLVVAVKLLS